MRGSRLLNVFVLVLTVGLLAAACSKSSPSGDESPGGGESEGTMMIGSDEANDHGTKDTAGAASTEVELDDFYFEPTVFTGTPGQEIKLELSNESQTLHNFSLQEQSIDEDVQAGATMDVTVTFPQSGFLEFFCKYHKGSGMVGELTISS